MTAGRVFRYSDTGQVPCVELRRGASRAACAGLCGGRDGGPFLRRHRALLRCFSRRESGIRWLLLHSYSFFHEATGYDSARFLGCSGYTECSHPANGQSRFVEKLPKESKSESDFAGFVGGQDSPNQERRLGTSPVIKRVRPPSASEDISGEASMLPTIARVLAEEGVDGGSLRCRLKSQTIATKQTNANAMNGYTPLSMNSQSSFSSFPRCRTRPSIS